MTIAGTLFLLLLGAILPCIAIRSGMKVRAIPIDNLPSRGQHFTSVCLTQGFMLVLALLTARREWIELFPRPTLSPAAIGAALALMAVILGTLPLRWSWRDEDSKRRVLWMLPGKASDLAWWTLIALMAGVVEEIAYRGVMFTLLLRLTHSWWASVLICVVAFGLAHWVQGWRTALIIAVMSIGMHVIVKLSGDLYTAMAMHFVYDLLAGVFLLQLARRDNLVARRDRLVV